MLSNKAVVIHEVSCTYISFRFVSVAKIPSGRDVIAFEEKSLYNNSKHNLSHDAFESASTKTFLPQSYNDDMMLVMKERSYK